MIVNCLILLYILKFTVGSYKKSSWNISFNSKSKVNNKPYFEIYYNIYYKIYVEKNICGWRGLVHRRNTYNLSYISFSFSAIFLPLGYTFIFWHIGLAMLLFRLNLINEF